VAIWARLQSAAAKPVNISNVCFIPVKGGGAFLIDEAVIGLQEKTHRTAWTVPHLLGARPFRHSPADGTGGGPSGGQAVV